MRHIRLVMLHVGELHHQGGVLVQFLLGADDEFVQHLAVVLDRQTQGFIALHFELVGREAHVVCHCHDDGAARGQESAG